MPALSYQTHQVAYHTFEPACLAPGPPLPEPIQTNPSECSPLIDAGMVGNFQRCSDDTSCDVMMMSLSKRSVVHSMSCVVMSKVIKN